MRSENRKIKDKKMENPEYTMLMETALTIKLSRRKE